MPGKGLTEREWEQFFDLVVRIVDEGLPVAEKRAKLEEAARENDRVTDWGELVSWFE